MKKSIIVLIFIVLICQFTHSSEPECLVSMKLGIADAALEYKPWNWYFAGLGVGLSVPVAMWISDSMYYNGNYALGDTVMVAAGLSTYAVFIPAFFSPQRSKIAPPDGGSVDLECYRDGYKRRAKWKNAGAVLLGELTAAGITYTVSFILFVGYMGAYY